MEGNLAAGFKLAEWRLVGFLLMMEMKEKAESKVREGRGKVPFCCLLSGATQATSRLTGWAGRLAACRGQA